MSQNKTKPTTVSVTDFLATVSDQRKAEAETLIATMQAISQHSAVMWGPSIIGFGDQHYTYESGREGDMPLLGFSPRMAKLTVYFSEGFDDYGDELRQLGKHTVTKSCLYIRKLSDVDMTVLAKMLQHSYDKAVSQSTQATDVATYIATIPAAARPAFDQLRRIAKQTLPNAREVVSYGIIGYKIDEKRARVFISGWKDHVAMYPVPKDENLQSDLQPYVKGKGTLWFDLAKPLPTTLIEKAMKALVKS